MIKRFAATIILAMSALNAGAVDFVYVPDASKLFWQMDASGRVWFRNFNQFNGVFLGCCYNFYLDTASPAGKAEWATILLKMGGAQGLYFGVDSAAAVGPVIYIGNW